MKIYAIEYSPKTSDEVGISYEANLDNFLSLYLSERYFKQVIILNSGHKYLRNRKEFGINNDNKKCVKINSIEEVKDKLEEIKKACYSHGHMSILFLTNVEDGFMNDFLSNKTYIRNEIIFGKGDKSEPLSKNQIEDLLNCLSSINFNKNGAERILVFSHDAEYLFQINKIE